MYQLHPRLAAALLPVLSLCAVVASAGAQTDQPAVARAHTSFTTARTGTSADSARAIAVVQALRTAVSPYQTLHDAEAAGYRARRDPETVKTGKLLHVGRRPRQAGGQSGFDPGAPQALLYRREPDGSMRLAGAMFVAPLSATTDDLDAMIPLSVAHWHQHTNICIPADHKSLRRLRRVTTQEACAAQGGRFRTESRYMIHVMTDAGDDLALAFPQGQEEMAGMEMGPAHQH